MGVSHFDLIRLLIGKGLDVIVCDKRTEEQLLQSYRENYEALKQKGAKFSLGDRYTDGLSRGGHYFPDARDELFHIPS